MDSWVVLIVVLAVSVLVVVMRKGKPGNIAVRRLIVYPIKSCAGISVEKCRVTDTGLYYDRCWAIVDRSGEVVTARNDPRLWRIIPALDLSSEADPKTMTIKYEGSRFELDLTQQPGERLTVQVWNEAAEVADQGTAVATWLKTVLGKDYRLFRIVTPRPHTDLEVTAPPGTTVLLADMMQFLLSSEASFHTVVRSTPEPKRSQLAVTCFRPNVVVTGATAFAEDTWREITIGKMKFVGVGACSRCSMTTIDPATLQFDTDLEPLITLKRIHGDGQKGYFGQWFVRAGNGVMSVGDRVEVISYKSFPN